MPDFQNIPFAEQFSVRGLHLRTLSPICLLICMHFGITIPVIHEWTRHQFLRTQTGLPPINCPLCLPRYSHPVPNESMSSQHGHSLSSIPSNNSACLVKYSLSGSGVTTGGVGVKSALILQYTSHSRLRATAQQRSPVPLTAQVQPSSSTPPQKAHAQMSS